MRMMESMGLALLLSAGISSCTETESRYLDLATGQPLTLTRQAKTGLLVDAATGRPPRIYVDREEMDTIWGATGRVINGKLVHEFGHGSSTYSYRYSEDYRRRQSIKNGKAGSSSAGLGSISAAVTPAQ